MKFQPITMVSNFFRRIKKLIDYAPIIWRDEDWDHAFLLDLLHFKMRRMFIQFKYRDKCVKWGRELEALRTCTAILARLKDDSCYDLMCYALHVQRWGAICHKFHEIDNKTSRMELYFPKAKTEAEQEQASNEFHECMKREAAMKVSDLKNFCALFEKNLNFWWS